MLHGGEFRLNLELPAGSRTLIETRSSSQIKIFSDLILNFRRPESGRLLLDGHDVDDFNEHRLRDEVQVIDSTFFPECTIADFMEIASPGLTRAAMRDMLVACGLGPELESLPDGLDQALTPYGHPLSVAGVLAGTARGAAFDHGDAGSPARDDVAVFFPPRGSGRVR